MNLENALKIHGWTTEAEITWLALQASTRKRIVEIGSFKGRSTRAMADNTTGEVFAVDTFDGGAEYGTMAEIVGKPEDWLYDEFLKNKSANTTAMRMPSVAAAKMFAAAGKTFDMVFIDGNHSYEDVHADLLAWMPLLEDGGLLCGHDFDAGRPGTVKAVRELVPNVKMAGAGSIWVRG